MARKSRASKASRKKKGDAGLRPPGGGDGSDGGGGGPPGPGPGFTDRSTVPILASDIPAPPDKDDYYPDQLTLYGVKLNPDEKGEAASIRFGTMVLKLSVNSRGTDQEVSMAVVYGYSYEGHCYRLDRTRLFVVGNAGMDADGCGFVPPYFMWRIRARAEVMEVAISHDTAETLILNANLPGNRAPNTYGNDMQLAHRGGRLNRPSGN
jgi:hypothetical protein